MGYPPITVFAARLAVADAVAKREAATVAHDQARAREDKPDAKASAIARAVEARYPPQRYRRECGRSL